MTLLSPARIAAALAAPPPPGLWRGDRAEKEAGDPVGAAVLVAITDRPRPGLLLIHRPDTMRAHAGQIAFPGGRIDAGEDAIAAALREAWEELALDPARASVLGTADPYRTVTGYGVTPVVALVPPDLPLAPNPAEVADWFEAPLDYLLDPGNQQRRSARFEGRDRHYYEIAWEERRIWGATAAMIVNLSKRIAAWN